MASILIVEDDGNISDIISLTLTGAGYACQTAFDGESAADMVEERDYDLILLDIMLPVHDGFTLMEYIRPTGTPVIFLTAKAALKDRIRGLKLGADDYIVKPFAPEELLARVEAVLRRTGKGTKTLSAYDVTADLEGRTAAKNGKTVALTNHEFDLLCVLMRNRGIALYRDALYEQVWEREAEPGSRSLDLHIMRLRQKLGWQDKIVTVYKIGYRLETDR